MHCSIMTSNEGNACNCVPQISSTYTYVKQSVYYIYPYNMKWETTQNGWNTKYIYIFYLTSLPVSLFITSDMVHSSLTFSIPGGNMPLLPTIPTRPLSFVLGAGSNPCCDLCMALRLNRSRWITYSELRVQLFKWGPRHKICGCYVAKMLEWFYLTGSPQRYCLWKLFF